MATDDPDSPRERRAAARLVARLPVGYSGERREGRGTIVDLSSSGALLFHVSVQVPVGTKLELEFGALSDWPSFALRAEVVRCLADGFAVQFIDASPETVVSLREVLERIAASKPADADQTDTPRWPPGPS